MREAGENLHYTLHPVGHKNRVLYLLEIRYSVWVFQRVRGAYLSLLHFIRVAKVMIFPKIQEHPGKIILLPAGKSQSLRQAPYG